LNASQLGTQEDRRVLERLRGAVTAKEGRLVCFVLNKVDLLDDEKGERLGRYTESAKMYLEGIGFNDPVIIPCISSFALYARKQLAGEQLTRVQRSTLINALDGFSGSNGRLLEAIQAPSLI